MDEESVTAESLTAAVTDVFNRRNEYITAMEHSGQMDYVKAVLDVIESV